jgi:dipeptidase
MPIYAGVNFVTNWATLRYSYMIEDIQAEQSRIEYNEISDQADTDNQAMRLLDKNSTRACSEFLTNYSTNNALSVVDDCGIFRTS